MENKPTVGNCAICGRPLTQVGPKGECLRCLADLGFLSGSQEAEKSESGRRLTPGQLKYDHFEVEVGADGFPVELGAGAMAITYRARDTILNSEVALKVIDRKVSQMPGARSRFLREARAAAQIRHPNVAHVSHYGEQDGECFYVMDLVEGETLEARVRREGPMQIPLAFEVVKQLSGALAAAEACGVVHRDIKPSNIMLESDPGGVAPIVKVIDYGVAKVLAPDAQPGAEQTQAGFIGTPAFASPEQFTSSEHTNIDARSDIYSLGVTIWYLLTGHVPFVGRTLDEIRVRQAEPLPLEQLKSLHIPTPCLLLLKSMLAPDPKDRPQTARELLEAVHRAHLKCTAEALWRRKRSIVVAAGTVLVLSIAAFGTWLYRHVQTSPEIERSIAVLPFENLSSSADDAYLASGIQDGILTTLASLADLKVISRSSSERYKSKPANLKTVGQQLGVTKILEGSVQRFGDKVRVTAQLIDMRTNANLWANTYDRELKDVFAVESEISQTIVNALQPRLSAAETSNLTSAPTQDAEAYDLFLKGEYAEDEAINLEKGELFDRASDAYQQALARDPNFRMAAVRLVESKLHRHWFIAPLSEGELHEVKNLADRTLAAAPNLSEAHIALGFYYYFGKRQYDDALTELQRALELQPNNIGVLRLCAFIHRRQGQWKRALSEMERCEERDPRNPALVGNIAATYCSLRMWTEARRTALRTLAIDPHSTMGLQTAIWASVQGMGNIEEGKRTLADYPQGVELADFNAISNVRPAVYVKMVERDFAGALKLLETEVNEPDENRARLATRAAIHVLAGDSVAAQNEIDRARALIESRVREQPNDASALLQLSWVNIALQRNAEALRLAYQVTKLVPIEKDALRGTTYVGALAEIQARTGATAEAVKTLRQLFAMPGGFGIQQLKLEPTWDPIRNDPGFQELLTGKELIGPDK